ncbi:hypothetical protein D3C72_85030 [compost metagenome]
MMELIQRYYAAERHTAMLAIAIGLALILISLALSRTASAATLTRGMVYVFLVAGLLQSAAGLSYFVVVGKRAQEATKVYAAQAEHDIKQQESTRLERVLKSGYIGGLAMYTALLLIGLALLLLSHDAPTRKGMALALMIIGVLGHGLEAYSMQANQQYLKTVVSQITS